MRLRLGKDANGRAQGQARKNIVLAFLANSRPEEINHFLDLILQPFSKFFIGWHSMFIMSPFSHAKLLTFSISVLFTA